MNRSLRTPSERAESRRHRGLLRWSIAAMSMAGISLGGFSSSGAIPGLGAVEPPFSRNPLANREVDDAITREFSRFALNALLAPLLDDDEPPRWSDVALRHYCGPAAHVEVNGLPLFHGSRIPTTAFTLRWSMDQCTMLEAIELNGTVKLLVQQEGSSVAAVVSPERLSVSGAWGTSQIDAPFASRLSLLSAKYRP